MGSETSLIQSFFVLLLLCSAVSPKTCGLEVVHDADLGADDAMAMLMLLSSRSNAIVHAITIATGNTGSLNGTLNALLTRKVANRTDVPVYQGSEQGLVYLSEPDPYFGYDGLGDIFTDKPSILLKGPKHAAEALADIVRQRPGCITVLVTGPLTNIALAIHFNPKFLEQVKAIVILGGSYRGGGSKKPGVEFNIYSDPEAAAFVFSRVPPNKPVIVVPMETFHSKPFSLEWRKNDLGKLGNCFIKFLNRAERISLPRSEEWIPADQIAAAVVLEPDVISATMKSFIQVETCGNIARGAFFRDDKSSRKNVIFITDFNMSLMKHIFLKYMDSASAICV